VSGERYEYEKQLMENVDTKKEAANEEGISII